MNKAIPFVLLIASMFFLSCKRDKTVELTFTEWTREGNPVLRDLILNENYQAASDAHVFLDGDNIRMIYTGDYNGKPAIKIAHSNDIDD